MPVLIILILAGCSRGGDSSDSQPTPADTAQPEATVDGSATADRVPCEDGRLIVGDLPDSDGSWDESLAIADERALQWQEDAQLVEFRLTCALFGPGFRVQATYFSPDAQALFASDTNESRPITIPEGEVVIPLDMGVVSFELVRDALTGADFTDDLELEPSTGVDVRVNMTALPFGPPEVPANATVAHVSVIRLGEVKDLYVDVATSQIYRYTSPAG